MMPSTGTQPGDLIPFFRSALVPLLATPTVASALWLLGTSLDAFGGYDTLYLCFTVGFILFAEMLLLLVLAGASRRLPMHTRPGFHRALLLATTFFGVLNAYYFLIIILEAGQSQKLFLVSLIAISGCIAVFHEQFRKFLMLFFVLLCLMPWFARIPSLMHSDIPRQAAIQASRMAWGDPDGKLRNRRNIYILSFDAMVSEDAYRKLFHLDELPWLKVMRENGMHVIPNAMSAGSNTNASFKTILSMGESIEVDNLQDFFSGASFNPAYEYFRNNDYKIQFMYHTDYFGTGKNGIVDFFYPPKSIGLCEFLPVQYGLIACRSSFLAFVKAKSGMNSNQAGMRSTLKDRITQISKSNEPWFSIAYFGIPGHTLPHSYHYSDTAGRADYIRQYEKNALDAAVLLDQLLRQIRELDPEAVILVFGDHGAWLTRGLKDGESSDEYSTEKVLLDRYGVTFAVHPKDFCPDIFTEHYGLSNLVPDVNLCLSKITR